MTLPADRLVLLVTLYGVLVPRGTAAQNWSLSAGAGANIPMGTGAVQEGIGVGVSATGAVAFALGRGLEIAGRFAYSRFPRDDDGVLRKSGIEQRPLRILEMSGGTLTLLAGALDLRFLPSQGKTGSSVHPFLLTSAGLTALDLEPADFSYAYAGHTWPGSFAGAQGTHFALGFGAGLRFVPSRRFHILLEGRYEILFRRQESLRSIPLRFELALGG